MSAVRSLDPTLLGVAAVRATLATAFVDDPMTHRTDGPPAFRQWWHA